MVVQRSMTRSRGHMVPEGVELTGKLPPEYARVLTPEALGFVAKLEREFRERRASLLERRARRQADIDRGDRPDFSLATQHIREGKWTVAPIPNDLLDRRVEITGPTDRKMIINALNSGANVFMADFEDSNVPTWENMVQGQINLCDAIDTTITYMSPEGKEYSLKRPTATTLMVRPRGLHLFERHLVVDGKSVSASLFDFGIFFFHNARKLLNSGSGPYFYLPKMESHLEARLWNDILVKAQDELAIPVGSVRATVLIETIFAAFEMDEILYELKDHSAGLNCGRWDYIFSCLKAFRNHMEFLFPDRSLLTMNAHFLRSYSRLLIQTCHRRGIHAMGGMAAYIPVKSNSRANERALKGVRLDKEREVVEGHDGSWVAHPGLIPVVRKAFDDRMRGPHQIYVKREDVLVTAKDLLTIPEGDISSKGLSNNISVGLQYLEAWLRGTGCVAINNLMEDTATAEICRSQLWHWIHNPGAHLAGGGPITKSLYHSFAADELARLTHTIGAKEFEQRRFGRATELLDAMVLQPGIDDFLTLRAYESLD